MWNLEKGFRFIISNGWKKVHPDYDCYRGQWTRRFLPYDLRLPQKHDTIIKYTIYISLLTYPEEVW